MAYMPQSERHALATMLFTPLEGLARWFGIWRSARANRAAFLEISELPEHRLNDIGLSRDDIHDALKLDPHGVMSLLYERRSARSGKRTR